MHETVLNRSPLMLPLASSGWDSMYSLVGLYLFAESRGSGAVSSWGPAGLSQSRSRQDKTHFSGISLKVYPYMLQPAETLPTSFMAG